VDENGLNIVKVLVKQYNAKFIIGDHILELNLAEIKGDRS
jgi:tRNA pseudouridine-54 N-methylase